MLPGGRLSGPNSDVSCAPVWSKRTASRDASGRGRGGGVCAGVGAATANARAANEKRRCMKRRASKKDAGLTRQREAYTRVLPPFSKAVKSKGAFLPLSIPG